MDKIVEIIIKYLKQGLTQSEIADQLKKSAINPNSQSSVEKKLNQMKEKYKAKTLFQLACILHNNKVLVNTDSRNGE